ncbi:hypothetical protein OA177_01430 [Candidatus Pelagibacter sp.]|nr:hypothetical protein [Candidatus Pelagibacter sp.]
MVKTFSKISIIVLFLILSFVAYFSLIGFETKNFNNQIQEKLKKIDTRLDVKLNDVKIVLDLFNLNINAKTLGPVISYKNKIIDIELIKSNIPLLNLINREFSLTNLFISTKTVKLKDIVSFYRVVNKKNRAELLILENFINKGYLIADVKLSFDDEGNIKDDLKINGLIKDASISLLNKKKVNKINFTFETFNKNLDINDLKFLYEKVDFSSQKIKFKNKDKLFIIDGQINNKEVDLSKELLKELFNPVSKIDFENLKFSSSNKFLLKFNDRFKILDYEIKSLLDINELSFKNSINTGIIFPNSQPIVKFRNHKTEIIYNKNNLAISGNGNLLIQKNLDRVNYKIEKIKDKYLFDIAFNIIKNQINLKFLNYITDDNSETSLKLNGELIKDKYLNIKKAKFENGSDEINIDNLILTNNFRISKMKSAIFSFTDIQDKKNIFQIKDNKENYVITGKVFNASKLIDDLIFEDTNNTNIFEKDYSLKIDLKEVYLHDEHIVYGLKGNLRFVNNKINNANINSKFDNNDRVSFTVISNGKQKVTTLFSDRARPFVQKFNFIKGFDNGSLDFYSVKSENVSNSKLKIYDFKLKELPALTKVLTLASLQGIADLLSGDGIGFSEFEMNFENRDKLMKIDEIYAIGPAISILMEGYIETGKLISLRGTLVPATTINKAIGSIPVIGEILVGKKTGEGVFGVSFKIKGPPKKLETSVNPIKTLTPRFITRTLEKIKRN